MRKVMASLPLLALAAASPVTGQTTTVPPPVAGPAAADDKLDIAEADRRMTVPVSIGTAGPFQFVIDTGAERTVVSRELAGSLGLMPGRTVRVTTMAGTSRIDTVLLPLLKVSRIAPEMIEAPAVEARNLGAPGMLGLDALKGHAVAIDFDANVMTLRPSSKRELPVGLDDIVVRAKNLYGQLIVTNARYRGRRISVIIDTGSPVTVGNSALLAAIRKPKALGRINLLSVTGEWLGADYTNVDSMEIGGIGFQNIPVAFADALPFRRFGLGNSPALLLGMDTLRLFRRVSVDFANREVRFTLPRNVGVRFPDQRP
ncbi:aspartyl protease family protein [uncultured Sphingomonas sp.]|uniref:aspartyl protease family protein n=1 Tax=uncultured Sphingomonas sp. TaxID=158754 RepID=UPI0035CC99A7